MNSALVAVPEETGQCQVPTCRGTHAKFESFCKICQKRMKKGDCIYFEGGWIHVEGVCVAVGGTAHGYGAIEAQMVPIKHFMCLEDAPQPSGSAKKKGDMPDAESEGDSSKPNNSGPRMTAEQKQFVEYRPQPGEIVRGNARAGSGKTTIAALLANAILEWHPRRQHTRIGYFVFGRKAMVDAVTSAKFPKQVIISTTHSYAKRRVCQAAADVNDALSVTKIALELHMEMKVRVELRNAEKSSIVNLASDARKVRSIARSVTRFIVLTLDMFFHSDVDDIEQSPVYWKATEAAQTSKLEWKSAFKENFYRAMAGSVWEIMKRGDIPYTHDGYLKAFQLKKLDIGPVPDRCAHCCPASPMSKRTCKQDAVNEFYICEQCNYKATGFDVILIDEAQDLTPCQASAFWGRRGGAIVYLLGDYRQRLYGWRGARDNFEKANCAHEFSLTNSFRFGKNIADAATRVLQHGGNEVIHGVAADDGVVGKDTGDAKVIIARTNKGMIDALIARRAVTGHFPRAWAFLHKSQACESLVSTMRYAKYVQLMKQEPGAEIRYDGETFETWKELKEYANEMGDSSLTTTMEIVESYGGEIFKLAAELKVGLRENDGTTKLEVIVTTCHQAKGMEFEDPVLVFSDFGFDKLLDDWGAPKDISKGKNGYKRHLIESINLIYVAITRARKSLQMTKEAWEYFKALGGTASAGPSGVPQTINQPVLSNEVLDILRAEHEREWSTFQDDWGGGRSEKKLRVSEIPMPRGPPGNEFATHDDMTADDVKCIMHKAFLRYHEDKFFAKFGWAVENEGEVKEVIKMAFTLAKELWDEFREAPAEDAATPGTAENPGDEHPSKRQRQM
eukprot:GEMP01007918.1.p1 GENE.GEMP01007918.1~~GEMP01007918.1.p1  ORF type:complete len:846 (+),score=213.80 GEMP01007918.1:132-2669(+)